MRTEGDSEILTPHMKHYLASMAPSIYQYREWQLLFSTSHDGISYSTLFCRAGNACPVYVLVEDAKGHVFGAYASQGIRDSSQFYGTGESFVFSFEVRDTRA